MKRISFAITAKIESQVLDYLVTKVPRWMGPDFLTLMALLAAALGGVFYVLATKNLLFLHAVNICLVTHWLTDSLDGKIARHRNTPRPNYGFYVDHLLDSVSAALLLGGLTTSSLTETAAWIWILALMLIAMIHVFLKSKVLNRFEMSIELVGPTEARLALIGVNLFVLLAGNPAIPVLGIPVRLIDWIGWTAVAVLLAILLPDIIRTAVELDRKDTHPTRRVKPR